MAFQSKISNEDVALLPAIQFGGKIVIIDTDEALEEACNLLAECSVLGFDTETRPSFKAGVTNKVSLLQLSTYDRCYLIRLNKVKFSNKVLSLLQRSDIMKIGADVAGDIRSLHALRNFKERGFIDLQQIASCWGIEEKSLRKMSALVLGERVSKAQRLSNWEASTLTPQQQMYAATDAWVCIKIYEKLMATQPLKELPQLDVTPKEENKPEKKSRNFHRRNYKQRQNKRLNQQKYENTDISSTR